MASFHDVVSAGAAPPGWSIVASPNTAAPNNYLTGASCASTSFCIAVGQDNNGSLIERWDGTSWSIDSSGTGAPGGLTGVSCPSTSFCMAVSYGTSFEEWNGSSWTVGSAASIVGTLNRLVGVSCSSPTFCMTAGWYSNPISGYPQTLIEEWDGTSWSIVTSPNASVYYNEPAGVSCASPTFCIVAGIYRSTHNSGWHTLIEQWDGTSWSVVSSPNVDAQYDSFLSGVSCSSLSFCIAAGNYMSATTPQSQTLVERWDGSSWSVVSSPNTDAQYPNLLAGVSCASPSFCVAAGSASGLGTQQTLIEQWDGTTWTIANSPNATGTQDNVNYLYGASCVSPSFCMADGYFNSTNTQTLIEEWAAVSDTDLALAGVPSNITVNANSPNGAVVGYAVPTVVDEAGDTPAATVSCDHPSGATYGIGVTTVTCTASSADDTPAAVSQAFTVTVSGAAAQITTISNAVPGLTSAPGVKNALLALLRAAQTAVSRGSTRVACATMGLFTVTLQVLERVPPPFGIPAAQANVLIAESQQVRATLGC